MQLAKKRIYYLDFLKVIATFFVIIIHVTAENWYTASNNLYWIVNNSYNAVSRWSVPVFVMVSGALFLSRDIPVKRIFTKYIPRIMMILLVWGLYYWLYSTNNWTIQNLWDSFIKLCNGESYSHLWYLYMLIGLYLVTPILRVFVKNADRKIIEYTILLFFVIQVVLPYISEFVPEFMSFYNQLKIFPLSEYMIYYLGGYYFSQYDLSRFKRFLLYISSVISLFAEMIYIDLISYRQGTPTSGCGTFSLGTFLIAFSIFIFAHRLESVLTRFTAIKWTISFLSPLTFGIYLLHFRIEKLFVSFGLNSNFIHPILGVPLITILVFLVAGLIVYLLLKIPYIRKLVQ